MFALLRVALITMLCLFGLGRANAVTVQDEQGSFTLDTPPQRIVVLELSFADALAAIDVSPVGIADDNDPDRILAEVREHLKPWHSVGTRAQPSLEAISALKPDLIIADSSRHSGIYTALKAIAPVLLLKSRNETYDENLHSAEIIGKVLGKDSAMQARLAKHRATMKAYADQLPKGTSVAFGTSREQQFNLYSSEAYTGSVLAALGLSVPKPINNAPMASINLEQLLAEDHAYGIFYWLAGGVSHARWVEFWQLFPFVIIVIPVVLLMANQLNLLNIGDVSAHTLGVNLGRLRLVLNLAVLVLVGACVSVAGPVAFIGLLIPHLARFWIGYDQRKMLPMSMLMGAAFMLLADLLARALAWPGELPAGAVLALIGAPCFVWLARKRG
ncbi:iron-dicitrate transporter substrate-binding subunit [Pectobacterium atrosepticum ICMP 1526]|uniref:Fe(3+) dicitrate ABC transporter substrate-binding protein n=1 Tax=Pectobacterium atrosepticum TaxID=29471 RepID=UPI00064F1A37|nr:Fe(3+) dicitrate ABC transporter substrate-binding protein [Pectobacterium atrosepticum]KMK80596.1 iron-dicitrate transporter substrate-binding subunit [Pectobacterium atrosepticum ICMP 1526]